MTVNVVGASGQLGRRVVRELLKQGLPAGDLIASVRNPRKAGQIAPAGTQIRRADYDDPGSMVHAFQGTDVLLLIPTFAPVEPRIMQHFHALEAARKAGVDRVVFSSFVGGGPESPFTVAPFLLYAESKLRLSGMDWTILRNGMYADPLVPYAPELARMGRIPYPAGDGRISYISRDDLARATAAACLSNDHTGRVYELTGPRAVSIAELARILTRVTGKPIRYEAAAPNEFAAMCREPGIPDYIPEALVTLYQAAAQGHLGAVTDHVLQLTGSPAEELETYLSRNLKPGG